MKNMIFALCMLSATAVHADIVSQDANGQISVTTVKASNLCIDGAAGACKTIKAGVNNSDRVGINNTNPATALDVGGTITATGYSGPITAATQITASTVTATFISVTSITATGSGKFGVATSTFGVGGVIGEVDYTLVANTTTITSGIGNFTVFSTITIAANTLARNGDALELTCAGTLAGISEVRTFVMKIGSIAISSRTVAMGTSAVILPDTAIVRLIRTSAGNQVRMCLTGTNNNNCVPTAAAPAPATGTNTFDETAAMVFTCSADGITAGSTSFLYSEVKYLPGP